MIHYETVKNWKFDDVRYVYTDHDVMLYALAAGLGADPLDRSSLDFVYEKSLKVLPSFVTLAGWPGKSAFSSESTAPVAASTQIVPSTVMPAAA